MIRIILFTFLIFSVHLTNAQEVIITGKNIEITSDGSNIPNFDDGTNFGFVPIGSSSQVQSFTIRSLNTDNKKLKIESISISPASAFSNTTIAGNINNDQSKTFDVTFNPVSYGVQNAVVTIVVKKPSVGTKEYSFNISGNSEGTMMISQYYDNGIHEFVEIKNISGTDMPLESGTYYLCMYGQSQSVTEVPNHSFDIYDYDTDKIFSKDEVLVIEEYQNDFFQGNNIIIISKTNDNTSFNNRIDIIGDNTAWGLNNSFTKGSCASEIAHMDFDMSDWVALTTEEVDAATATSLGQNISKGFYHIGATEANNGSWSNGVSDRTRDVIIVSDYPATDDPNGYYSMGVFEACNLTVQAGNIFSYQDANNSLGTVSIYKNLTVESGAEFILGDKKSLMMWDDNALITMDGIFTKREKSTILQNIHDITYWASPVQDAVISDVFQNVNPSRIFEMNPAAINAAYGNSQYQHWFIATGSMEQAKGYAAESTSSMSFPGIMDVNFTGTPNNGPIAVPIDKSINASALDTLDYNLIGNPYPSSIDADLFIDHNKDKFEGTIYFWTHGTELNNGSYTKDDYIQYNKTGGNPSTVTSNIGSAQGFLIKALQSTDIVFNNNMRLINKNDQFYKSEINKELNTDTATKEKDRIWLQLSDENKHKKEILIGFFDQATDAKDYGYDGLSNSVHDLKFYSLLENNKYAIQGLSSFTEEKRIGLGFDTENTGAFTIGISKMEGELKHREVFLVDNLLRTVTDLSKGDYTFYQPEAGEFKERFSLQFSQTILGVKDLVVEDDLTFISTDDNFKIIATQAVKEIVMYDLLGRTILSYQPDSKSFYLAHHKIKKGTVILVKATLENGKVISKKIIKY